MNRRNLLAAVAALSMVAAAATAPMAAQAQTDKPLKILVGFPAGGSIDVVTRIVADKLKDELRRPVIVDNRAGAGGRLAADLLKSAAPDGNTVMVTPVVVPVLAPMVFGKLNYDPLVDFAPVARVVDFSFALAVPASSPIKTLKDYAAALKADPRLAAFGSPAPGSLPHFFGVMIGHSLNVELTHVPFNGGAALQSAVLGGHVPAGIDVVSEWQQNAKGGKVTVLATSGAQRSPVMPDVPTFKEQGYPDIVGQGWFGLYAPAKAPADQLEQLARALGKVLTMPDVRDRLLGMGFEVGGGTPADLRKTMAEDTVRWGPIVKKSGFRAD